MKMIFKNFVYVLKRFKTSSILNILGLSAAFSVFIVLMIQVYYDFSFDRNFKNADEIYMLSSYYPFRGQYDWRASTYYGDDISEKSPLIESHTTVNDTKITIYINGSEPETAISESLSQVRGNFENIFTPDVLEGDLKAALAEGNNLAISDKTAKKLFGDQSPIGKIIINYHSKQPFTIRAVIADFPDNCSLSNGFFSYLEHDKPNNINYSLYFKIGSSNVKELQGYLNSKDFLGEENIRYMEEHPDAKREFMLIPLTSIHLHFPTKGNGDFNTTLSLMAIAILTLIIAYINFINFSIAMAPARVKALTIQQIFGMGKNIQIIIIAIESAIFSLIAFCISLLIVNFINSSSISELFSADILIVNNVYLLIACAITAALIGFLIGLYPSRYITTFDIIDAIKGTSTGSSKSTKLRSALITLQFAAAIVLIIITLFIKIQHSYMVNYSWGIQKDNIVYIDLRNKDVNYKPLADELLKDPRITDYTLSQFAPGHIHMGWYRSLHDKQIYIMSWPVADNYLDFFGVEVIYGENFPELNNPDKEKLIFNEEFLRKYEFTPDQVLGQEIFTFDTTAYVMGIAKDINFASLKMPIRPMAFVTLGDNMNTKLFLKLSGTDIKKTIRLIENTWARHSKEPLDLQFLDENLEDLYHNESNLGKLVGIFSIITIIIAIMGVYGLITFNTKYRKKEIALRKINGADENTIVLMLNKGMLLQLLIGFIIACPIAYFAVSKWLSNFAYRTDIHWWVFPLAGILILIITIVSVSWQSYKAAIANPIESLKSE